MGVSDNDFYHNIATFKGASNRLELVQQNTNSALYKDFAHSPSKLKATSFAMKKQFNNRELVACMELHTFSSLNEEFLKEYKGCMHDADIAIVYFNPKSIALKKIKRITKNKIIHAFDRHDLLVFTNSMKLEKYLKGLKWKNRNLLMMSSGNFNEIDFNNLIKERPN